MLSEAFVLPHALARFVPPVMPRLRPFLSCLARFVPSCHAEGSPVLVMLCEIRPLSCRARGFVPFSCHAERDSSIRLRMDELSRSIPTVANPAWLVDQLLRHYQASRPTDQPAAATVITFRRRKLTREVPVHRSQSETDAPEMTTPEW